MTHVFYIMLSYGITFCSLLALVMRSIFLYRQQTKRLHRLTQILKKSPNES